MSEEIPHLYPAEKSFDRPNRTHRTHTIVNIPIIAKMTPAAKFGYNKLVEERNDSRRIRELQISGEEDISDVESFITVDDYMEEMVHNPSLIEKNSTFNPCRGPRLGEEHDPRFESNRKRNCIPRIYSSHWTFW